MKILVTRHGKTDWNEEGRLQGRTDIHLNSIGIEQAKETKEKLKNEKIDLIICSPLTRAKQTADIINEERNIPIRYDERLIEMCYGEYEGKIFEEIDYFDFWNISDLSKAQGAETINGLLKRVAEYIEELKNYKEENILLVTHNGICRAINAYFNGIPENNNILALGIKNCEFVEYKFRRKKKFVVYAHRGASSYAPENTLSAFKKGIELGANGIELDLQKTKDGKIVIFHDDYIDRKSNGIGKIEDYTYEELLKLDFGGWFDKKFSNEKIMLFEEFAKEFFNKPLTFAIELKVLEIEKEVLEIIEKYKVHDRIFITSFIYEVLENVRKINKEIKISWLVQEINENNINKLLEIQGSQICPRAEFVTKEKIKLANSKGLSVRLWGVFDENIMKNVYELNIDGMTVNFPDKLNQLIKREIPKDIVVYETDNFHLIVPSSPHIPREDGGHLVITSKELEFENRTQLDAKLATEIMRFTMIAGEAMTKILKKRGVKLQRINYHESGNWPYLRREKTKFHIHLYGRAYDSKTQICGEAVYFPNQFSDFYEDFEKLDDEDVLEIRKEIKRLEKTEKYRKENWNLS